ncbi:MAG: hypothetical protein U0412_03755 [Nitrospira sp.]
MLRFGLLCGLLYGATLSISATETLAQGSAEGGPEPAAAAVAFDETNPSIALKGSVWRTKPGIVFLRTPVGLLTLSSKTTLKDMRASQEVSFWIHGPHMAVEIRKRADGSLVHRYLSGPFSSSGDTTALARWTPEGEKTVHVGTYEAQLSALKDGNPVTVEVDATDTVVGVHDLQFDLQIAQVPTSGADVHILLTGTVAKLKSNFIFFRTPVGMINVNAKIGIRNAKMGQTMTLHVHQHHVVADLTPANGAAPAHRFITGPLQFATPDHTSMTLWTPEGQQTFPADRGKAALAGTKEGSPINVELNGQGTVVDIQRLN